VEVAQFHAPWWALVLALLNLRGSATSESVHREINGSTSVPNVRVWRSARNVSTFIHPPITRNEKNMFIYIHTSTSWLNKEHDELLYRLGSA